MEVNSIKCHGGSEDTESLKINPWTLYKGKGKNVYMPAMYQVLALT